MIAASTLFRGSPTRGPLKVVRRAIGETHLPPAAHNPIERRFEKLAGTANPFQGVGGPWARLVPPPPGFILVEKHFSEGAVLATMFKIVTGFSLHAMLAKGILIIKKDLFTKGAAYFFDPRHGGIAFWGKLHF